MKTIHIFSFIFIISLAIGCGKNAKKETISEVQDTIIKNTEIIDTLTSVKIIDTVIKSDSIIKEVTKIKPLVVSKKETKLPTKEVVKTTSVKTTTNTTPKTTTSTTPVETKPTVVEPKETTTPKVEEKTVVTPKEPEVAVKETATTVSNNTWIVPAKYKTMKNPIENSTENLADGKSLYNLHCKSCHGAKGLGDGTKAKSVKGDLGDFSSAAFHSQTDGDLFYKTKIGRADMPGYTKKLSDEDIWLTVIFMRSLKK
jgi:mono/diheme cytochrome c family protein